MQSYGNEIKPKMLRSLQIQSDHPLKTLDNQIFSDFSGGIEMKHWCEMASEKYKELWRQVKWACSKTNKTMIQLLCKAWA